MAFTDIELIANKNGFLSSKFLIVKIIIFLSLFFNFIDARADQEVDSLLNNPHETSWAYFTNPANDTWYISNSIGITYGLGLNNSGHSSWVALAQEGSMANIDFSRKQVRISDYITDITPNNGYWTTSLVGGEGRQYVNGNKANQWASMIAGKNLALKWYFFKVESTQKWYIVSIAEEYATIFRLNLNSTKSDYDWKKPLDGSTPGVSVETERKLKAIFFQENNKWMVRFSIPDFSYNPLTYNANPDNRGYCYPQCVDFVRENLGLERGRPYAKDYWTNPQTNYSNYSQGISTRAPRPGDILVWSGGLNKNANSCPSTGCGHVAIVKSVNLKNGTLTRVDANWGGACGIAETNMTITKGKDSGYTISGSGSGYLLGWQSKDLTYFN